MTSRNIENLIKNTARSRSETLDRNSSSDRINSEDRARDCRTNVNIRTFSTHLTVATPTDPVSGSDWEDERIAPVTRSDIRSGRSARVRVNDRSVGRGEALAEKSQCAPEPTASGGEEGGGEGSRGTLPRHALRPRVIDVASRLQEDFRGVVLPFPLSFARKEFLSSTRRAPPFYFWTRAADATRIPAIADINRYPSGNRRRDCLVVSSVSNRHSSMTDALPTFDAIRSE